MIQWSVLKNLAGHLLKNVGNYRINNLQVRSGLKLLEELFARTFVT